MPAIATRGLVASEVLAILYLSTDFLTPQNTAVTSRGTLSSVVRSVHAEAVFAVSCLVRSLSGHLSSGVRFAQAAAATTRTGVGTGC
jgi:hypothetical protein